MSITDILNCLPQFTYSYAVELDGLNICYDATTKILTVYDSINLVMITLNTNDTRLYIIKISNAKFSMDQMFSMAYNTFFRIPYVSWHGNKRTSFSRIEFIDVAYRHGRYENMACLATDSSVQSRRYI